MTTDAVFRPLLKGLPIAVAIVIAVGGIGGATARASLQAKPEAGAAAKASEVGPRLYIEFKSEDQRPAAVAFRKAIAGAEVNGRTLIAMPPTLVSGNGVAQTELRCMTKVDCGQAQALAAVIGRELGGAPPKVRDLSAQYDGKTPARPLHYELWFGDGPIPTAPRPVAAMTLTESPEITRLVLGSVKPGALRQGQTAVAEFQVTMSEPVEADPPFIARLKRRLFLDLDGRHVSFDRLAMVNVSETGDSVVVSGTFRPVLPPSRVSILAGQSSVAVSVGDLRNEEILSPALLIPVTDGNQALILAALLLSVLGMGASLLVLQTNPRLRGLLLSWLKFRPAGSVKAPSPDPSPVAPPSPRRAPPTPPPELLAAVAQRSAVLVVGAGVSALSGAPTLTGFIRHMIAGGGVKLSPSLTRLGAEDLERLGPAAMDALLAAFPRDDVLAEAQRFFGEPGETGLMQQLLTPSWRGVIALTLDSLVEQTLSRRRKDSAWRIWTLEDGAEMATGLRDPAPFLVRPYGVISRPASLLFSPDELQRQMYRASEAQRSLSFLLQNNSLLFVGVAPAELQALLTAIAPHSAPEARHFALLPDDPANEVLELSLERFGVRVLPYAPAEAAATLIGFVGAVNRQSANAPSSGAATASQLHSVRLTNIGIFRSLELQFDLEPNRASDWTVLFGGNGVGKSTVLRSIALVLAGDDPVAVAAGRRLLRSDASVGSIELRMGEAVYTTELRRDRNDVRVRPGQLSPVQAGANLVLGFPALRGAPSANPRGPSRQKLVGPQVADIAHLVSAGVDDRLGSFKQWLVNVLVEARDGTAHALAKKELLETLLREMVPGDIEAFAQISAPDYEIRLRSRDGEVAFDSLSQGMSSIFNWLGVLVQRLYDVYPDAPAPERETALVLIDEIDSHLHPDWQRRIVELTKRHFPKVQMIATSHSALLAGALRKGELCIVDRREDGEVILRRDLDLFGLRAQDILQGPAFGLSSDRAPGAEREIQAYFKAFEKAEKTPQDAAVIETLGPRLEAIGYGKRPTDPLAALTPADIEALKGLMGSERGDRTSGDAS